MAFTPDGSLGFAAQEDGSLGILAIDEANGLSVVEAAFSGDFYASRVVPDPTGEILWIVDPNWVDNGGGIYRAEIDCETGSLSEPVRLMDVGAGTGILSMCAAAAAAQQGVPIEIFAVEGSKMAAVAQQLVAANGFSAVVRVIHSAVEELDALPAFGSHAAQKVDIIVSEWMGFYLLHESMLSSVPFGMKVLVKKPTTISPSTAHFCVTQFGSQQWFMKRARLDMREPSMMLSASIRMK